MIVLAGALLGALLGIAQARRRGGTRLDLAHHAAAYALAFAILGLFLTLIVGHSFGP
ncbi:MAG: hypothetical protein ACO3BE_07075 [Gemmobacter sp.]|jgi:hypothetical protein